MCFDCGRLLRGHKCAHEDANSSGPNLCKVRHGAVAGRQDDLELLADKGPVLLCRGGGTFSAGAGSVQDACECICSAVLLCRRKSSCSAQAASRRLPSSA